MQSNECLPDRDVNENGGTAWLPGPAVVVVDGRDFDIYMNKSLHELAKWGGRAVPGSQGHLGDQRTKSGLRIPLLRT